MAARIQELKTLRTLASEITALGASLHELLGSEIEMRVCSLIIEVIEMDLQH